MKNRKYFRLNLYNLFAISIIIPLIIETSIFMYFFSNNSYENTIQQNKNTLEQFSSNLDSYYSDIQYIATTPYLFSDINTVMKSFNRGYYFVDILERNQLEDNYSKTFTKLIHTNLNKITSISFIPIRDTSIQYQVHRSKSGINVVPSTLDLNDLNINKLLTFIPNPKHNSLPDDVSCLSAIYDYDTKNIIGYLNIVLELEIYEHLADDIVTNDTSILTVSSNDDLIFTSSPDNTRFLDSPNKFEVITKENRSFNWSINYHLSKTELHKERYLLIFYAFTITITTILVAFIIFNNRSKSMVNDINSLIHTLDKIRGGDLSARATTSDDNELATISNSINQMAMDLETLINHNYLSIIEQRNAENRALQSQINPHFLYNTLNCILALNKLGEKKMIERSIVNLSSLLRYALSADKFVTIEQESKFIEEYFELQKLRFNERLIFNINIDPSVKHYLIPKLLIQPLVENSIVHGLEPIERPVHIIINAYLNIVNETIIFEIIDDGKGFIVDNSSEHIGLENVKNRLKYWNDSSIFEITSSINQGTSIQISFKENL